MRKENPEAGIGDIAKILGKMWGEVDSATKTRLDKVATTYQLFLSSSFELASCRLLVVDDF